MRMARTSPISSVTVCYSCLDQRRFWVVDGVRQRSEAGGGRGRRGRRWGTAAPADPGEPGPQLVGVAGRELGEAVANDPSAVAVIPLDGEVGLAAERRG